jgi:hypothetical protein
MRDTNHKRGMPATNPDDSMMSKIKPPNIFF